MDRESVRQWLEEHPGQAQGAPEARVRAIEEEVRRRASAHAWREAEARVASRMRRWERGWGFHASEAFVAKEVCAMLARQLRAEEPALDARAARAMVPEELLHGLGAEARRLVLDWVDELAPALEHEAWRDVLRFTRTEGGRLARERRVSDSLAWEASENWAHKAAHVAQILIEDYERRAREAGAPPQRPHTT